jgi:hypothetical protein
MKRGTEFLDKNKLLYLAIFLFLIFAILATIFQEPRLGPLIEIDEYTRPPLITPELQRAIEIAIDSDAENIVDLEAYLKDSSKIISPLTPCIDFFCNKLGNALEDNNYDLQDIQKLIWLIQLENGRITDKLQCRMDITEDGIADMEDIIELVHLAYLTQQGTWMGPIPAPVNLISPTNNSNTSENVTLTWFATDPNYNNNIKYDVYFGYVEPLELISHATLETEYLLEDLEEKTYNWRITSHNIFCQEDTSETFEFTVPFFSSGGELNDTVPTLTSFSPTSGATSIDLESNISWIATDEDNDLLNFTISFGTDIDNLPIVSQNQHETSYNPTLELNTTYYWRINAIDENNNTITSNILNFTTIEEENEEEDDAPDTPPPVEDPPQQNENNNNQNDNQESTPVITLTIEIPETNESINPGGNLTINISLQNQKTATATALLNCELTDNNSNTLDATSESLQIINKLNIEKSITLPENATAGIYVYICTLSHNEEEITTFSKEFEVTTVIHEETPFPTKIILVIVTIVVLSTIAIVILLKIWKNQKPKKRPVKKKIVKRKPKKK